MKLLFFIKSLAVRGGGAERVLAEVTGELARRGHEVIVACFDPREFEPFYAFDSGVKIQGLSIGRSERKSRLLEVVRRIIEVRRITKEIGPDVVIGFMHSAYLLLGAALRGTGIPVIASEHIVFGHYSDRPLEALLLRLGAPMFATFTATSSAVGASFPSAIRDRMIVIPNPVTTAPESRADVVGGGARKLVLAVGRLTAQKDQGTLIDAFGRLAPAFPEWDLRIVGEGELRGELEAQIDHLRLGGRVSLPGATRNVEAEYAAAQLFVTPSAYESFGLVTAEALAHGLPAIGFADCPGTNEIIEHGRNGVLVSGDPRAAVLADALAELMSNPKARERLGRAGPKSVEQFGLESVANSWEALFRRVSRPINRPTA